MIIALLITHICLKVVQYICLLTYTWLVVISPQFYYLVCSSFDQTAIIEHLYNLLVLVVIEHIMNTLNLLITKRNYFETIEMIPPPHQKIIR